jgi:hypothetical protein
MNIKFCTAENYIYIFPVSNNVQIVTYTKTYTDKYCTMITVL